MKPSTSKVDGKKRKRDVPLVAPEVVKKTKVHAQRKFAQGTGLASSAISPIKERERNKPQPPTPIPEPLLTNKVPTTQQFLDFLCFGRTPLLPPELHYLKNATLPNSSASNASSPSQAVAAATSGKKTEKPDRVKAKPPPCVEALQKKYKEQRLAKQKATSVTTLAKKVKGKIMVRTRSAVGKEDVPKAVKAAIAAKRNKKVVIGLRSGLNRAQNASNIVKAQKQRMKKVKLQRVGLRSGGKIEIPKNVSKDTLTPKIKKNTEKDGVMKGKSLVERKNLRQSRSHSSEVGSDFSSDDNEPLLAHKKAKLRGPKRLHARTRSRGTDGEDKEKAGMETRPSRRSKAVAPDETSKKHTGTSTQSNDDDDDASTESLEPSRTRTEKSQPDQKPTVAIKKTASLAPKNIESKKNLTKKVVSKTKADESPGRISTRSTPVDEKLEVRLVEKSLKKAAIRGLIQKKKLMSVRTLSRLKNSQSKVKKTGLKHEPIKKEPAKANVIAFDKKEVPNSESPSRRLRGQIIETPDDKPLAERIKKQPPKKTAESKLKATATGYEPKGKQKVEVMATGVSKRPARKCSTVDKMWIDVDGFTSDEEDFIDIESITCDKKNTGDFSSLSQGKAAIKASTSEIGKEAEKEIVASTSKSETLAPLQPIRQAKGNKMDHDTTVEPSSESLANNPPTTNTHSGNVVMKQTITAGAPSLKTVATPDSKLAKSTVDKKTDNVSASKTAERTNVVAINVKQAAANKVETPITSNTLKKTSLQSNPETIPKEATPIPTSNTFLPRKAPHSLDSQAAGSVQSASVTEKRTVVAQEAGNLLHSAAVTTPADRQASQAPMTPTKPMASEVPTPPTKHQVSQARTTTFDYMARPTPSTDRLITPTPTADRLVTPTPPPPVSCVPNTHALIARLAAHVARTSKPPPYNLDFKPVTKDLKTLIPPSSFSAIIKEETCMKADIKFNAHLTEQAGKFSEVEDKKNIIRLCSPNEQKITPDKSGESKIIARPSSSACSKTADTSFGKAKSEMRLKKEDVTAGSIPNKLLATAPEKPPSFVHHSSARHAVKVDVKHDQSKNKQVKTKTSETNDSSNSQMGGSRKRNEKSPLDTPKRKLTKAQELETQKIADDEKNKSGSSKGAIAGPARRKQFELDQRDDSSDGSGSRDKPPAKRGRKPSPRAEVVTRRERPKRQCSATGKSWIERDSDDSSFYDDNDDVLELVRQYSLQESANQEDHKEPPSPVEPAESKLDASETFSESDDEPLMKKTVSAQSPGSPVTTETTEGPGNTKNVGSKSEVPQEGYTRAGASGLDAIRAEPAPVPDPAVTFRAMPREPINTHGLDLLSEVVAVADKSKARIEQWLKESLRADARKGFVGFDETEIRRRRALPSNSAIPDPVLEFVRTPSEMPKTSPPDEVEKSVKKVVPKVEVALKRPPVSSVHDLLKLQKGRKRSPMPVAEQHQSNCKCNSCVVKKAWFKNKPVPDDPKPSTKNASPAKPFQAFGEGTSTKASVSVAPFLQSNDSPDMKATSPRKMSFLERMRERERKEALVKPSSQPFSPSNDSSVYAFEPEPERSSAPARTAPSSSATRALPTSHEEDPKDDRARHQSTSIAVQVNLDTSNSATEPPPADDGKSIEISTQTEGSEEEPDSQMFYIPLQQSGSQQPLIQGVTVKLGTEGPVGPNQKVVMQAKLVTKPLSIPSMKAVVMPQKKQTENTKNTPPVGTVQPTTRKPPGSNPSPRLRDNSSPSSAKSKDAQCSVRAEMKSQAQQVTPLRTEAPLASSTSRPAKGSPKPSASTASDTRTKEEVKESNRMVDAPTFYLTEKEFQDPLEFFERIRPAAESFGLCRIVPPVSFKPDCKVADDMRFTAYNQYVHRMLDRWGPSVKETMAMKKYLKTQRISLKPPPCVGGMEVDLPRLYQAVQTTGGLMKVMEKQKWQQVADLLRIPKAAHDRATKLDSIYCQYLLPYDTLSTEERTKLMDEVDADWAAHEEKMGQGNETEAEDEEEDYIEECEECIVKGRSMALSQFFRIARNTMSMWFKSAEPGPEEVEAEFWRHVTERKHHVCVHSGSIDSSGWGYGFPVGKNTFAKHPWNLKVLTNNSGSVLRSLGPVMGVTVPTLHVGMVFAAFCWYRDPHGLPWVEYLHTGAPKIWYGISDDNSTLFREALTQLLPKRIKEQRIWLPCDTAMAPPARLAELGVPLSRITQHPGQFVLVFPRAFTSSLCTGYLVSESVYFARSSWLQTAEQAFRDIHDCSEPSVFSLDNLLLSIAADTRASLDILNQVLPMVRRVRDREREGRRALRELGLVEEPLPREPTRRRGRTSDPEPEHECEVCRASLFLSMVSNSAEETVFCLKHALQQLKTHADQLGGSKLLYTHDQDEINQIVEKLEERIDAKGLKNNKK